MSMTLYALADAYTTLRQLADDADAFPDAWEQALADLQDEGRSKVANIGLLLHELDEEQAAITIEIARLEMRRESRRNVAERLKAYLLAEMPALGLERVTDPRITVWLQDSPPAVEITEPEAVPVEFRVCTVRLPWEELPEELRAEAEVTHDKRALRDVLKDGLAVPGAVLRRSRHVRIR